MAIAFVACNKDKDKEEVLYPDELTPEPAAVTTNLPAATIGSAFDVNFMAALDERLLAKQTAIDATTQIVLVHNTHLAAISAADKAAILEVYNRGGDVVLIEPEFDEVDEFSEFLEHVHAVPTSDPDRRFAEIYAFNQRNQHYILGNLHPDGERTDVDPVHYGVFLNPFIEWLNKNASDMQSKALVRYADELADLMRTFDYQTVSVSFPIYISGELAHVASSDADVLTKSGAIQVVTTAYPIHAFDDQASPGDYYLMHQEITVPNGSWYKGKWTNTHGGVHVRLCAFFMQNFRISNTLSSPPAGTVALKTSPTTTIGSTSYTSGVSWHLDASVTGGTSNDHPLETATVGGGVTVSNSETRTISDMDVRNLGSGVTTAWGLDFNNLASYNANISINEPAVASRSTQVLLTDWIWYFPAMKDASTTSACNFTISVDGSKWGGSHFYSTGADFSTKDFTPWLKPAFGIIFSEFAYSTISQTVAFAAPNRTATGQLKLKNNDNSGYLSEIKIWKSTEVKTATPTTIAGSIARGEDAQIWLPVGTYKMELKIGTAVYHTATNFAITRAGVYQLNGATDSPDFTAGALP
jgi:PKD repeat protein